MERLIREILTKDLNTRITIFQTIFDAISDYIFIMKADEEVETFKYLFANKHALDNLQLDESIYGKSMEEVLPAERVKFLKQKYQEAIITKKTIIFEERYFTKKGAVIGEMALNPIFIEDGKSVLVFAIVRDVTERKNREQALLEMQKETQRNEQKLSSLIKNNTEAVYEFDTKGHFRSVNEALEKILGYSSEELIGKAFVPLLIPEEVEKTLTHFQKAVEGTPQEYELTLYNQLYEKVNVNIKNIPIIVDGKVDGVYGIAKNITEKKKIEQEKSELRQQLEMVWNNTSDAIFLLGTDTPIVKVNPSFTKILGFTEEEVKGKVNLPFLPPYEGHNQMMEIREKMRRGEIMENLEVQRIKKDGSALDILASYRPVNKGEILGVGMYKDITERKKIEKRLQASEERYRTLFDYSPEPILLLKETKIIFCNQQALKLIGVESLDEVKGIDVLNLIHPDDLALTKNRYKQIYEGTALPPLDRKITTHDGKELIIEMTGKVVSYEGDQAMLISAKDVTARKMAEEKANYLAFHDDLTGLGNRRFFNKSLKEVIQQAKAQNQTCAVLTLDLDNFKNINDTFGHDTGDDVLRKFSTRLKSVLKESCIISRTGGDEVGILCPNMTKKEIENTAQEIIEEFCIPIKTAKHSIDVDISIGIAMYPTHAKEEFSLIKCADIALYHVKKTGKGNWLFYSEKLGETYISRLTLERQLKEAIKNEAFSLHYQPRIDARTGKVNSVEALIRWDKSTPDVFIPIAEETGLIHSIGRWVTRTACQQLKKWQDKGLPIEKVSVNLSIYQLLHDKTFIQQTSDIIKETGVSPACLEFEITERFISHEEKIISCLEEIKALGISISIDDFGKEYSSLWCIRKLPIDSIKLDKSFIDEISTDPTVKEIVKTIISLSKSLKLKSVGEGVETEEQALFLRKNGIDEMQGYLFSRPLPPEKIEAMLMDTLN